VLNGILTSGHFELKNVSSALSACWSLTSGVQMNTKFLLSDWHCKYQI